MNLSPEALESFVQAAASGSFSAAARRLGKSQSTVSEAVARLEIDLDVELFVRGARQLLPTEAGQVLLGHAQDVLAAGERLKRHAALLARGQEARLTLALSDAYQQSQYEARLCELDQRYPDLEFECLIAERADVLDLVNQGRAHLGLLAAQPRYAAEIASARLPHAAEFGLFVRSDHPLASRDSVDAQALAQWRRLRLKTVVGGDTNDDEMGTVGSRCWAAPDYMLLMEMAALGFGWAILPKPLVQAYAHERLEELAVHGWPKQVAVDAVWSRQRPLGPAAAWLLDRLIKF
ncbi:LysR family transcriptional regulator [Pseudomonas lopnurensis]|uniref:LysR family transcriptional regulator n=1 Tax=Pseudomonas lopnurensis TaxID=1477517 RepID=UPI00187AFA5F|nr:LysR family transcriptional regulator [Pseudomonas lopnurensis]MBE7376654.1 LysR family transcriptional regulator [Pseudomonas lopnurensis]